MARTFNRAPFSVPTPSSSDVKNYYFNQAHWKGIIRNKNFLTVDQESFEDCRNVYVNDDNILKSRPSVKKKSNLMNGHVIKDVHYFDNDITVYLLFDSKINKLYVVKNNAVCSICAINDYGDYRLLQIKDFILLFTDEKLYIIDAQGNLKEADIYVPKTKLVSLDGSETDLESKNIFTNEEITVYLYTSETSNIRTKLLNKQVKVKVDGEELNFKFDNYVSYKLFNKFETDLTNIMLTKKIQAGNYFTYLPFTISSKNTFAYYDSSNKTIYYSVDGKIFAAVYTLSDELIFNDTDIKNGHNVEIMFCRNNPAILALALKVDTTSTGLYMLSVEADNIDGSYRYPSPTLIETMNSHLSVVNQSFDALDYNHYVVSNIDRTGISVKVKNGVESYNLQVVNSDDEVVGLLENRILNLRLVGDKIFYHIVYDHVNDGGQNIVGFIGKEITSNYSTWDYDTPVVWDFDVTTEGSGAYAYPILPRDYNGPAIRYLVYMSPSNSAPTDLSFDDVEHIFVKNRVAYFYNPTHDKVLAGFLGTTGFGKTLELINYPFDNTCQKFIMNRYNNSQYVYFYNLDEEENLINLYTNNLVGTYEMEVYSGGDKTTFVPSAAAQLTNLYISKGSQLYISQATDEEAQIYFPEVSKQTFGSTITNLHPLSESEMGIFLENEIWYSYLTEAGYAYRKSRLDFGCPIGSEIETSFDGKYTLFDCERGFAALSYQDFVASTEQSVSFVSDSISSLYKSFRSNAKRGVKLTKFDNYLFLYDCKNDILVYDLRTGSWWPWTILNVTKIKRADELILIKDFAMGKLDYTSNKYFDAVKYEEYIDWYITSQKLHFGANNNYKHITNMTFSAVEESENLTPLSLKLNVKNYRHYVDDGKEEEFEYKVDVIRTFVKRLNYSKVREFQYALSADLQNAIQIPLSLSAISIKYKVGGQVR